MARNFRNLSVWQKSIQLSVESYKLTSSFPAEERFGLISQIRRCAVSVPSNIAEGSERKSDKEFIRFLNIAKSSLAELETQIEIALQLSYLSQPNYSNILTDIQEIGKMINGLAKKLETGD